MLINEVTKMLRIKHPIIQAPMAGGITTSELVTSVSINGGLGMIGAGYLNADQLRNEIKMVKNKTENFGVNLFVPTEFNVPKAEIDKTKEILRPMKEWLEAEEGKDLPTAKSAMQTFKEQVQVVIEEKVPVCSFVFGMPDQDVINRLKKERIIVMGTATTVKEAIEIETNGMDVVIVQGSEAGGHRSTFRKDSENGLIGLMSLIPQVSDQVSIPVVAAGGIMDGRGLIASLVLGAQAVQMGTAFLMTDESGAHQVHKQEILETTEDEIVLTRAFSGKFARGIQNEFITQMKKYEQYLPDFPVQNSLTQSVRKAASVKNNKEYMSLWSGQSPRLSQKQSVAKLMETILNDAQKILNK